MKSNSQLQSSSRDKNLTKPNKAKLARIIFRWAVITVGVCIGLASLSFIALQAWPALGAQGADMLRSIIGDQAVANLEMEINLLQDGLQKIKYEVSMDRPVAPWATAQLVAPTLIPTPSPELQAPLPFQTGTALPAIQSLQPTPAPTPSVWQPANLKPLGSAVGEGIWSAYIQDRQGQTVAYRTFLQPDPTRPYALVAVVAIDLTHTRLHFLLGSIEPVGPPGPPRTGAIPAPDRAANFLLAAFNGGFKARHGQFGAMADGITALPPRDGLGTVVIYQDGSVRLGEWGADLGMSPEVVAFRQNGPLVIRNGKIDPRIYNNSPEDWGYTVIDVSPTVRTGIGLSEDESTLFYFCGPSLSMEALANSMQAAGAWNSIQLDINNYWALFVKFQPSGSNLVPEALLPDLMVANIERYLWDYTRDYFYITDITK